jgi:hypothetical protein
MLVGGITMSFTLPQRASFNMLSTSGTYGTNTPGVSKTYAPSISIFSTIFTQLAILRVMPDGMFLCELEDLADCGPIIDIDEKR